MRIRWKPWLFVTGLLVLAVGVYRLPPVYARLSWRLDAARAYMRGVIDPVQAVPTPQAPLVTATSLPSSTPPPPTATPIPGVTPTPTPSPTPLPGTVRLPSPVWEKQDWNNCGPATLALYLRTFGWQGDQFDISRLLKPERADRNVNVEELAYYVRTHAGWLNVIYRVGGTIPRLKTLLAAGLPVMIEEGFYLEESYWPNDDRWAGHYLLLTGYDDARGVFIAQDTFLGPDREVPYDVLDANWKAFNRVYILLYLPQQEDTVRGILGADWDEVMNRQAALDAARAETEVNPQDAFAWFNLGTNLVYFERYAEAAEAYDTARRLSLPQRMLRYQFGPFFAYFNAGRTDDLLTLTEYALKITPNSEEAHLWHGWALYRLGNVAGAIEDFRTALEANPNYTDARYALDFLDASP